MLRCGTLGVDDLCVACDADSEELLDRIVTCRLDLAKMCDGHGMPIVKQRCVSLGSSARLAKRLAEALGEYGGSSGCSVRRLGVHHSLAVVKKRLAVRRVR